MNEHTKKLLEECSAGCKMGINSMEQVQEFVQDDELKKVIAIYQNKHEELEAKTAKLLEQEQKADGEPSAAASVFSWITTEMKLMLKNNNHQIAKLMMDGCNMGIQSISKAQNECADASKEALSLAGELVKLDETFMKELKIFI